MDHDKSEDERRRKSKQKAFYQDVQALIDLITWYKDKYHRQDINHTELIELAKNATCQKDLDTIWQTVDSWLD